MASEFSMSREIAKIDVEMTANDIRFKSFIAPVALTIASIKVIAAEAAPTSASGTYLLDGAVGATSVLAAPYSLELLTADTAETLTLSATASALTLAAGAVLKFTATSDNADLVVTGTTVEVFVTYDKIQ